MLSTSLKPSATILQMPPSLLPIPFSLESYLYVFRKLPIGRATFNSLVITLSVTIGTLFFSSLAAFAIAKLKFSFKKPIFVLLLSTLMITGQVALIPMFIAFSKIGWVDTFYPLIIPPVLLNAYGVFMIKQFMETIPDSYIEAAKIDGYTYFSIYKKVVLPLCIPAMITLGLFTFIGHWNNFLGPLIFLNSQDKFTVPLLINTFRDAFQVNWGLIMAGATLSILPIVILYLFTQRYFIEGITLSGIKG